MTNPSSPRPVAAVITLALGFAFGFLALLAPVTAFASAGAGMDTIADIPDSLKGNGMASEPAPVLSTNPDYSEYQKLLNEFVVPIAKKGEPFDTRFDYEKLYDALGRRSRLVRIHSELFEVAPSRMEPKARLAWAINGYNFLVIEAATTHLLVPGRGRLRYLSVQDMQMSQHNPYDRNGFFNAYVVEIEGKKYSLDEFERAFVFAGFQKGTMTAPPPALDPRAHFAIVSGAIGCPPLMPRAYRPDSLDLQLDAACRAALALPRHLFFDEKQKLLEGSSIFNWDAYDWGGHDQTFPFVERYAPSAIKSAIKKHKITEVNSYLDWNWKLNQYDHPKQKI